MSTKFITTILALFVMASQVKSQTAIEKIKTQILSRFEKRVCRKKTNNTGILLIHSPSKGICWKVAANPDPTVMTNPDQPIHFASIGKTITSVMVGILFENGRINFEDKISKYLDDTVLTGLHVYKGVDYSKDIQIKHLLGHTSGLPDHYLDKNKMGVCLLDRMLSEPDHFWKPIETINWTKHELTPKCRPGKGFHYSDTNYELLGLIIEKVSGKRLSECLHECIFNPLEMDHTWQIFHSEPREASLPMVSLFHGNINLSDSKSISMSCASGGIVSTTTDMLKFHKAMVENKIIGKETFKKMQNYTKMGPGLYYGYGIMNFRFMFLPKKYDIWGNSGSIGAFMYYNPEMDVYMIGSFNKINDQVQPIFYILNTLRKFNRVFKKHSK